MSKYLDTSGLTYFWEKIKTYVDNKISSVSAGVISFKGRSGAVTPASGDYTASMVGADPTGTADSAVSTHNTSTSAHSDIRTELAGKETAGAAAAVQTNLNSHTGDTTVHITAAERTAWNAKESGGAAAAVQSNLDTHAANTTLHITADERTAWNAKEAGGAAAAVQTNLDTHVADTTAHITASERSTWNAKQAAISGAASTITSSNLTANRALISNSSGKVSVSVVTSTELGYLDGVTSNVQTQLNAKLPKTGGTLTGGLTMGTNNAITFTNGDGNSTADMFNLNDMFAHGEGVGILTSGQGGNLTYLDVVDGGIYIGDDCDNNIQIHGVGTPAADADAANKSYVDTTVSGVSSSVTELSTTVSGVSSSVTELSTTVSGVSSSVTELSKKVSSKGDMFRDVYDPDKDGCVLDADNAKKLKAAVDITIGSKTNSFNGSSGISFTLADIGAAASSTLTSHTGSSSIHVTSSEKSTWNAKANKPTTTTISLSTTWTGSASPYTQTVTVSGGTSTCKVDLQPDATAFAHMVSVGCNALFIVNNSGTFTAYAIGAKPTTALSIQATVTEVS